MANITETFVGDKSLQLGNEQFVRTMAMGSSWTKLRVCMRCAFDDSGGDILTAKLMMGVCTGLTDFNSGSADCAGFTLGYDTTASRFAGPPVYYEFNGIANTRAFTKVGATLTLVNGANVSNSLSAAPTTRRSLWFTDITKGTGLTTISKWTFATGAGAQADRTRQTYLAWLQDEATAGGTLGTGAASTPAYTGANLFDSVFVYWNKSTPVINIYDLTVIRFY